MSVSPVKEVVIDIPDEYIPHTENIKYLVKYFSKRKFVSLTGVSQIGKIKKNKRIEFPKISRVTLCELCGRCNHEKRDCYMNRKGNNYKLCDRPSCFGYIIHIMIV